MPTETGPNFKTPAPCWPRNELVLASPQVNKLAIQDDLNGAWPELWKYRRQTFLYKISHYGVTGSMRWSWVRLSLFEEL